MVVMVVLHSACTWGISWWGWWWRWCTVRAPAWRLSREKAGNYAISFKWKGESSSLMIFRGVQEWRSHPCICSRAGLQDHHLVCWPDTIIVNTLFTKKNCPTVHLYCKAESWNKKYKVVTWQLAKGKPQEPPALILGLKHMHCPPLKSGCCQFC